MLLQQLVLRSPSAGTGHIALAYRGAAKTYLEFGNDIRSLARGFMSLGLARQDRVAIFLDKQFETATAIFAAAAAGLVFVPINPALRAQQVRYIMMDCNVRVLITTASRLSALASVLGSCGDLRFVFVVGGEGEERTRAGGPVVAPFEDLPGTAEGEPELSTNDTEMAGILYTSGSTGNPKGVVFSHRNFVAGAQSVAQYLKYRVTDRVINIPPYSFDFGLNQLFSTMHAGATAVLHNFVAVEDLMQTIVAEKVTGVSGVPTVMIQLAAQEWPAEAVSTVRYLSTTGGRMPEHAVRALRRSLPKSDLYLMYGLTEAFRSTFLPPEEVDRRPGSIGKAIPNAEVLVVRPDGSICDPEEPGELVHKGVLVTLGYWNDPVRTAERFRPAPGEPPGKADPEIAVWSGDTVKRDADGFIYYVGRRDEMIKTSGYRVSPTEVEEAVFASGEAVAAAAIGVEDEALGQSIVVFVTPKSSKGLNTAGLLEHCRRTLPAYMVPHRIIRRDEMPLNPNGKIDRKALAREYAEGGAEQLPGDAGVASSPFLARWRNELLGLLGVRAKKFADVAEVFRWNFPDREVSTRDSFRSLGGDSLSYVNLYVGLSDHLGHLPADWAQLSVSELEKLDRSHSTVVAVAPDILLRVVALLTIVLTQLDFFQRFLPDGAACAMMMISGMSFARFSWNEDARKTRQAAMRFFAKIYLPILIFLAAVFAFGGKVHLGHLLLVENWVSPRPADWWGPGWYIENLCQCIALVTLAGAIGGVSAWSCRHKFGFAAVLLVCGLAAFAVFSFVPMGAISTFWHVTPGFFWLFALGWLVAWAQTSRQKIAAVAIIVASVLVFLTIATLRPTPLTTVMYTNFDRFFDHHFWFWIPAGGAFLLFGRDVIVPRRINTIIVLIAQSMLFVYLFHVQISIALPFQRLSVQLLFGTAISIALWVIWESFWRAWRSGAPSSPPRPQSDRPAMAEARSI